MPEVLCSHCGRGAAVIAGQTVLGAVSIRRVSLCRACAQARGREPGPPEDFDGSLKWLGPMDLAVVEECIPAAEQDASPEELAGTAEAVARSAEIHGQTLTPAIRAFVDRHLGSRPSA